jgi:hypothetical protein
MRKITRQIVFRAWAPIRADEDVIAVATGTFMTTETAPAPNQSLTRWNARSRRGASRPT